jgi:excisionase family DNA binding protein
MTLSTEGPAFYTPTETATLLRVTPSTVLRQIGKGQIHAIAVGRQFRIPAAELERILQSGTRAA